MSESKESYAKKLILIYNCDGKLNITNDLFI